MLHFSPTKNVFCLFLTSVEEISHWNDSHFWNCVKLICALVRNPRGWREPSCLEKLEELRVKLKYVNVEELSWQSKTEGLELLISREGQHSRMFL